MNALAQAVPTLPACGAQPDAVETCLDAVGRAADRLVVACLNRWGDERMAAALADAREAAAAVARHRDALADAFAPATEAEIASEGARLLCSWPQARHGDLAGYGTELALLMVERRPSQRALRQACRTLKLTRVHLPAIAEVIAALDAAERVMRLAAERLSALPERIARAEAAVAQPRAMTKPAMVASS